MSQYIKRSDALRIVDLHYGPCSGYNEIKRLPTEDVAPVVRGRWDKVIPSKSAAKWSSKVSCSVCHKAGYTRYSYCPNCGARMDGE